MSNAGWREDFTPHHARPKLMEVKTEADRGFISTQSLRQRERNVVGGVLV